MKAISKLFHFFWDKEFIRFLFASGVNTILGYLITLFFSYVCHLVDPWPVVLNFICCFPVAYTMQCKVAFRQKWELKRMLAYALTIIPNLAIQTLLSLIIPADLMAGWLRYAIIQVAPLPVMFFVIRFIVTPMKKKKTEESAPDTEKTDRQSKD